MPAAIYARISHDKSGDAVGVQRQLKECRALAPDALEFVDNSVSAFSGAPRPAYEAMLEAVERGEVDQIVAWASDRLYRRVSDLTRLTDILKKHRVVVRTVKSGDVDLSTADGILRAQIMGSVGEHESRKKGERVAASKKDAAERGLFLSTARPFGWQRGGKPGWWEPVPAEAAMVADAYRRLLAGESIRSIAHSLSAVGPKGAVIAPVTWTHMLQSPRHAGLVAYKGTVVADAADGQSLVSRDDWNRAQAILRDPARRMNYSIKVNGGRPNGRVLSGLALCGRCGKTMNSTRRGMRKNNQAKVILFCAPKGNSKGWHLSRIYDYVWEPVADAFAQRIVDNRDLILRYANPLGGTADDTQRLLEIEALRTRLDSLADLAADGTLDAEGFAQARKRIMEQIAVLESKRTVAIPNRALQDLLSNPNTVRERLDELAESNPDELRQAMRLTGLTVTVLPGTTHPTTADTRIEWGDQG